MFCQKCRTPLKLDGSLEDLNPTAWSMLIEASSRSLKVQQGKTSSSRLLYTPEDTKRYDEAAQSVSGPVIKRKIPSTPTASATGGRNGAVSENPSMSFVMLTESQMGLPSVVTAKSDAEGRPASRRRSSSRNADADDGPLSSKMETTARIFEILSSHSDIDHPICVECTDLLIEGMEKRLANATKERDAYAEYLKNAHADAPTDEEQQQAEDEIVSIRSQEAAAFQELERLEKEKSELDDELAALEVEASSLDREEEDFWRERNGLAEVLSALQNERDSLNLRYDNDSRQLDLLQRTNVYNDAFNIAYDKDGFGTINGLRLGRSSGKNVEWAEVNAAWGQAILLLTVVAERLKYTFNGYKLIAMGSTSTIDKFEMNPSASTDSKNQTTTSLSLFYSSDLPLSIGFLHRHFDAAMIAFLECVRQLGAHIERTVVGAEKAKKMPYEIKKDKIGDVSIKLGSFNGDESWTTACKRTLLDCKFLLAHASHMEVAKGPSGG